MQVGAMLEMVTLLVHEVAHCADYDYGGVSGASPGVER